MPPGQPLLGRPLVADADIGVATANIDLAAGGDQFNAEAVRRRPDLGDMAGDEGRGPRPCRNAHHALADGPVFPTPQREHGRLDFLGAQQG
ncbi:hypothetical protein GGR20_002743 [Devosia subaequoris]|uniref:Uncharacterized protein n=1 Tax=Devosia subaequoris TaxID=395930 RepID=A0A7W6INV0_9HYPH|nr:hypothetical protein [Devosia subaequoris]MBB4053087.1 hypothetical protein [Devosia subaequoris]MCP1210504.1 hypothetical protein [Devosia subaequoris]